MAYNSVTDSFDLINHTHRQETLLEMISSANALLKVALLGNLLEQDQDIIYEYLNVIDGLIANAKSESELLLNELLKPMREIKEV